MSLNVWTSPDDVIRKEIIIHGKSELKPTENCKCYIRVTDTSIGELHKFAQTYLYVLGNSDTAIERNLDNCLMYMLIGEVARVTFHLEVICSFTLELLNFETEDLIYNWSVEKKLSLALNHKTRGVELFKECRYIDASHRFSKGLMILCSLPIGVNEFVTEVDNISLKDIQNLKVNLYNNLASCYLKCFDYQTVLKLCQKVFEIDKENIKALYKEGVAFYELQDYEKSQGSLMTLLNIDSDNKAALEKLKFVNIKVNESNVKVNAMIKKMFSK
ncbi:hypothetical protein RI129_002563 [Pyrocoelia pectoralis]|uniref:BDBT FKBP like N-terminal domain-containing protein n=1 Tax=Pyrocoelia pectoralis TaxID=417401 RepID=A0AAN7VM56_9COLE